MKKILQNVCNWDTSFFFWYPFFGKDEERTKADSWLHLLKDNFKSMINLIPGNKCQKKNGHSS